MSVKVSVIMPTYKVEKYLDQCLQSVINQTLRDIEIIVVNDGSPDRCGEIIDSYAKNDLRIKPIHKKNEGYGKAINDGLRMAQGKYIAIVETDDWVETDMLAILYQKAEENNVPIVKGSFFKHYNDSTTAHLHSIKRAIGDSDYAIVKPSENNALMLYESSIWTALYKKSFLDDNKLKMLETPSASFQDLVWKFETYSVADKICIIDKPVYHYRVMTANSSSKSASKIDAMFVNYNEIKRFMDEKGIFADFKKIFYVHQFFDFVFHLNRLNEEGRQSFREKAFNTVKEADEESISPDSLVYDPDTNHYVHFTVKPVYEWVKAYPAKRPYPFEEQTFFKKALNFIKRKIKRG